MKRFICQIIVYISIIFVIDFIIGHCMSYLKDNVKGGDNWRNNYICNSTHEDVLIFGSSRAFHHYNPQIIADSLNLSCYNCGQDGNGIILNYGRLLMIRQRYQPKVIIYDISTNFDYSANDNHKYLGRLKPYYDEKGIKDIFNSVDQTERWKMLSSMYRYNSSFLQLLSDYFHPLQQVGNNGFRPMKGLLDPMKLRKNKDNDNTEFMYDTLKINYIHKFINLCKNTKLIFTYSPMWYGYDSNKLNLIKDICHKNNIPFLDFSNNPKYVHNNSLFKDGSHLNEKGANEYTKDLIIEILQYLNFEKL